jgi:hypothetical protein
MEIALEAGAEDVREDDGVFEVITGTNDFESVKSALEKAAIKSIDAEITMLPQNTTNLEGKDAEKMIKLMETLEDCDDVQKVTRTPRFRKIWPDKIKFFGKNRQLNHQSCGTMEPQGNKHPQGHPHCGESGTL